MQRQSLRAAVLRLDVNGLTSWVGLGRKCCGFRYILNLQHWLFAEVTASQLDSNVYSINIIIATLYHAEFIHKI